MSNTNTPNDQCANYESGFATNCKVGVAYQSIDRRCCFGVSGCSSYRKFTQEEWDEGRKEIERALNVCRNWPDKYADTTED